MAARVQSDLLDIVDAAYALDVSDADWLARLANAAAPHLDGGFGIAAFEYDKPEGSLPQIVQHVHLGIPADLEAIYHKVFETMDPEIRLRPFRLGPCITGSQLMGMREDFREQPHMKRFVQNFGMYDSIWITAAEPSGHGVGFHAGRKKIGWATPSQRARWGRIAAHLSTALRLRHVLRAAKTSPLDNRPDAVLDPSGKVRDAVGEASTDFARDLLRKAVISLERSRGAMRARDPDKSLAIRRALVAGRWSLVEQVDLDNHRYIVARQNVPAAPGPELLTPRERQVIAYAKLGHHNKLIAYDMGIADSTVRVLLARAAAKLGVRKRADLLRCYEDGWTPPAVPGPTRPAETMSQRAR
jgi:DNA-binding CsgD family transcriptional regulator